MDKSIEDKNNINGKTVIKSEFKVNEKIQFEPCLSKIPSIIIDPS